MDRDARVPRYASHRGASGRAHRVTAREGRGGGVRRDWEREDDAGAAVPARRGYRIRGWCRVSRDMHPAEARRRAHRRGARRQGTVRTERRRG